MEESYFVLLYYVFLYIYNLLSPKSIRELALCSLTQQRDLAEQKISFLQFSLAVCFQTLGS